MDLKSFTTTPPRLYPWHLRKEPFTVGVVSPCYGSSHVIHGLRTKRYQHRKLTTLPMRLLDRAATFYEYTPFILDTAVDLVHTWNAIPRNKDFIVSFELEMPRYLGNPSSDQLSFGLDLLESDKCKGMFALSKFAHRFATKHFEKLGRPELLTKTNVFRGAVRDPIEDGWLRAQKTERLPFESRPLSAIVIGTQLFRKGAKQAIQAVETLRNRGMNVSLTLIGEFEESCYALRENIPDSEEWTRRAKSYDWIRFEKPMPNAQILSELARHDVCVYTSFDESLGWLAIEASMLGIPVIANRVCAFEELIQHQSSGWLIDLPLGVDGRWIGIGLNGLEARLAQSEADALIRDGIVDCLSFLYSNPSKLGEWGSNGRRQTKTQYDLNSASTALEIIYDEMLAGRKSTSSCLA